MMTSKEISELTGKTHKNVLRDARKCWDEVIGHGSDLSHAFYKVIQDIDKLSGNLSRCVPETLKLVRKLSEEK